MNMKTKIIILIVIVAVGGFLIYSNLNPNVSGSATSSGGGGGGGGVAVAPTYITYENFAPVMSSNQIVRDVPASGDIMMRFYNFDAGDRTWEKTYVITQGSVKEGWSDSADLTIIMHSKYLDNELNTANFCQTIQKAKAAGDFGYDVNQNLVAFLWKYRGLNDYKSCFGF